MMRLAWSTKEETGFDADPDEDGDEAEIGGDDDDDGARLS